MTTLIIGGDGAIGSALTRRLASLGEPALATTRRVTEGAAQAGPLLDLSKPLTDEAFEPLPRRPGCVVFAAASSTIGACKSDPVATRRVNVDAVMTLARRYTAVGAKLVFLSSSLVFDGGVSPIRSEVEPRAPTTELGRQKRDAEDGLMSADPGAVILRLGKVATSGLGLTTSWVDRLTHGGAVAAFSDFMVSPVSLDRVINAILAARRLAGGAYHVTGDRDISYFGWATRLAAILGVEPDRVSASSAMAMDPPLDLVPRHAVLGGDRLFKATGLAPESVDQVIEGSLMSSLADRGWRSPRGGHG